MEVKGLGLGMLIKVWGAEMWIVPLARMESQVDKKLWNEMKEARVMYRYA